MTQLPPTPPRAPAHDADAPVGAVSGAADAPLTEEQLSQLIEQFESESATRTLHGAWRWVAAILAGSLSVYGLYWTQYSISTQIYRATFLLLVLALSFVLYPLRGRRSWLEFGAIVGLGALLVGLYWPVPQAAARTRFLDELLQPSTLGAIAVVAAGLLGYWFKTRNRASVPWYDVLLAVLCVVSLGYLILNYEAALQRIINPTITEVLMGILMILLVLESTRRTTGWPLPVTAVLFLIYAYLGPWMPEPLDHRGYPVHRIVGQNYLTLEGVFGVPLDVAATFIILFTIYGAVLEYSGAGKFFLDWSFAALGRSRSGAGAGRTATAAGFLLGTVSGSGVATTVTLGSLAWPMLRKAGYDRDTAGGILAASGLGAILSPPTLGAAAFLIAEYLDISYLDVLVMASIPTVLYYLSCLLMIEADSRRLNTRAVDVETPSLVELTVKFGYHFSSLFAVAILMAVGLSPFMAVFWSIAIAFALSFLRPETRLTSLLAVIVGAALAVVMVAVGADWNRAAFWGMMLTAGIAGLLTALRALGINVGLPANLTDAAADRRFLQALESGGKGALSVAATTATAGLIVSVVTLTGLGLKISGVIVDLSGGIPLLTVVYAALAVWVLGLAVPVTASYIIAAVMIVPALRDIGVPEPAAHMFIFYYAVLSDVSPPTALSPFAAAAITGGNPFRTMMLTWKYCMPAFLVPFMFTLNREGATLLLLGDNGIMSADVLTTIWTFGTACIAVGALAVTFGGWMVQRAEMLERVILGLAGVALLYANPWSDVLGVALLAAGTAVHLLRIRTSNRLAVG